MSGVIDAKGVQWEHCSECGLFTRLADLGYQPKSRAYPYGRDLCLKCVNGLSQWHLARVRPAPDWLAKRGP